MIRLLGNPKRLCDGLTRRDLLQLGGLGMLGLNLSDTLRLQAAQKSSSSAGGFGKAKACILVYLFGAPSQHETFDPKPAAPAEIRGEMKAISTSIPGVAISEGLPRLARIMDRLCLVRSLNHPFPFHHVHYAISGIPDASSKTETTPNDRSLWPFLGSVVDYFAQQGGDVRLPPMPRNLALPFRLYSKVNFSLLGGPYAGFLGSRYDPIWTEFSAKGTRAVPNEEDRADVFDPYAGIRPSDRFELFGSNEAPDLNRIGLRRSLLTQFEGARRQFDVAENVQNLDRYREVAYSLLNSSRVAQALDFGREPMPTRERYGMTLFGQSLLAARRVIEAGGKFVTVIWDAYVHFANGWDTHHHQYRRLREYLLPGFDQSFTALILDLEARGMLDDTLVLCLSEHGRTPKIAKVPGGGRDHWSRVYSTVLAGGGLARGRVVGKSDAIGSVPSEVPVSPKDILATALHLLGIDPHTMVPDRLKRPVPVAGPGMVRNELLA